MYKDVSRWMSACHEIESKHNKVKRRKTKNNQSLESKEKYSHYLCFTVSVRSNDLLFEYNKEKHKLTKEYCILSKRLWG